MEEDYLRLYKSLNEKRVKYVVVGGIAAILYGSVRLTKDIDIFIEAEIKNASRLLKALRQIGFGTASLTTPKKIVKNEITIFKDYIRLDVLTKMKALSFQEVWKRRAIKRIKGIRIPVICLSDLIVCKEAVGRSIDLEDIKVLRKFRKSRGPVRKIFSNSAP